MNTASNGPALRSLSSSAELFLARFFLKHDNGTMASGECSRHSFEGKMTVLEFDFPSAWKLKLAIEEATVTLTFTNYKDRNSTGIQLLRRQLHATKCDWLRSGGVSWLFDVPKFLSWTGSVGERLGRRMPWLRGTIQVTPQEVLVFDYLQVQFSIHQEEIDLLNNVKVFLSHKGADKPMVRGFHRILEAMGYSPWLDEEAMPAGTELHRGILQGFQESCAAVFFITPNFKDETYLRGEINYAIEQRTAKGERFKIITLVFSKKKGEKGIVPPLLKSFVWKEPKNELEALEEIVRAIPIEPSLFRWKDGV